MNEFFSPITGLTGGSLVGLSAATLLLFNGDVLGASGVMSSLFTTPRKVMRDPSQYWKLILLASFLLTSAFLYGPEFVQDPRTVQDPSVPIVSPIAYSLAGLLVGFGTQLGDGCTSGHGVCGLGRRSPRSLTAVITFMTTAIVTVTLIAPNSRYAPLTSFLRSDSVIPVNATLGMQFTTLVIFIACAAPSISKQHFAKEDTAKVFAAGLAGSLFASGLATSQMVIGSKLYGFLNVSSMADGAWDVTLATVLGSALLISFCSHQFVKGFGVSDKNEKVLSKPLLAHTFSIPTKTTIDTRLVLGAATFGIGWAIALLCPGPALFHAAVGNPNILFRWMPAFVVGSIFAQKIKAT